ncbi:MAG TPA: hypothetical protein VGM25_00515 [Caulobacteraceae bacterium]|jgi:hypothetical protein
MLVRYMPLIFILAALVLTLAPLETAAQSVSARAGAEPSAQPEHKADRPRPTAPGAPVNTNADDKAVPPGVDARQVRPAQAFPPERFAPSQPQAPSRGGVQTPDRPQLSPGRQDDPRSVEEQPDPGG